MMAANQQFCLRWNNHQRTLISVFDSLLESGTLVDCTLAAEGQYLKAHKVVLSACSPYLGVLLSTHHEKHPILILKDIRFQELKAMLDYMYKGEVNISQEQLCTFLKAAESLQIKGLTESAGLNPESKEFEERVKRHERKNATSVPLPNHNIKIRSPPINAIVDNVQQSWVQKFSAPNFRPTTPPVVRDGSISPVSRKRRKQQHPLPNNHEDTITSPRLSENQEILQQSDSSSTVEQNAASPNPVVAPLPPPLPPPTTFLNATNVKNEIIDSPPNSDIKNVNSPSVTDENSKPLSNDILVKTEPTYFDTKQSTTDTDAAYEDSMEDMDEEEESEENDISRPGPSHSEDSQPYGSSYAVSCDSDGVSSGQLDCQAVLFPLTGSSTTNINASGNGAGPIGECYRHTCPKCGRTYKWRSSLKSHLQNECGKEPSCICPHCPYRCKVRSNLLKHVRNYHKTVVYSQSSS